MEICKGKSWNNHRFRPCYNIAKKDGFCMIHHPDTVQARKDKSNKKYNDDLKNRREAQVKRERIEKIHQEIYYYLQAQPTTDARARGFVQLLQDDGVI